MRRVARFLAIDVTEEQWPTVVEAARFQSMREEAIRQEAESSRPDEPRIWKDGAASFFYKGTNGRWRDILTGEDLTLYEQAAARLDPGLRTWLENGSLVSGDPQQSSQRPAG
jgi:aryl sulfotransferase